MILKNEVHTKTTLYTVLMQIEKQSKTLIVKMRKKQIDYFFDINHLYSNNFTN